MENREVLGQRHGGPRWKSETRSAFEVVLPGEVARTRERMTARCLTVSGRGRRLGAGAAGGGEQVGTQMWVREEHAEDAVVETARSSLTSHFFQMKTMLSVCHRASHT